MVLTSSSPPSCLSGMWSRGVQPTAVKYFPNNKQKTRTGMYLKKKSKCDFHVVTFTKKSTFFALKMHASPASKYVFSSAVKIFLFVANVNLQKSYQINRTLKEILCFERQSRKAIPTKCSVSHHPTDPFFQNSRITCKEASTLIYKHTILSY